MNALGHTTAGLVGGLGDTDTMCFLQYEDKNGGIHPNISHFSKQIIPIRFVKSVMNVLREKYPFPISLIP